MKMINKVLTAALIMVSVLAVSCDKDDDNTQSVPAAVTTGNLKFTAKKLDGTIIPNASISISVTQEDLDNNNFIATKITDSNGMADFGKLNAGNYYYEAEAMEGLVTYDGSGVVQIQAGGNVSKDITLQ